MLSSTGAIEDIHAQHMCYRAMQDNSIHHLAKRKRFIVTAGPRKKCQIVAEGKDIYELTRFLSITSCLQTLYLPQSSNIPINTNLFLQTDVSEVDLDE